MVAAMKVYSIMDAETVRLIGRCDVPEESESVDVPAFGPKSGIMDRYVVLEVRPGERGIVLAPDQRPERLPGWQPLAS
jgi:hypothetical protein